MNKAEWAELDRDIDRCIELKNLYSRNSSLVVSIAPKTATSKYYKKFYSAVGFINDYEEKEVILRRLGFPSSYFSS